MKKIIIFMVLSLCGFAKDISIHLEETVINKFLTSASFFSDTTKKAVTHFCHSFLVGAGGFEPPKH